VTTAPTVRRSELESPIQVFEPHKASLPPMGPYLREFWRRRRFAYELSRTTQKADHFDSPIGKVWLVLNPLLLSLVYFLLIEVLSKSSSGIAGFLRIVIALFTWYYVMGCMTGGATSVTAGGKLILNQAFPRVLLPASSVITAFLNYLPTIPVYLVMYGIGLWLVPDRNYNPANPLTIKNLAGPSLALLWQIPLVALLTVSGFGLAMIFATMTVYFRDTTKFLSYMLRIWLYLSPVLYTASTLEAKFNGHHHHLPHNLGTLLLYGNPLGPALAMMGNIWFEGKPPSVAQVVGAVIWAIVLVLFGGWIFISRERDFAVRL
jgi:teichoic acid transport system permease protein